MRRTWLLAALLAAPLPAAAHEWYPLECCHAMDCAPVDKVEILPLPAIASMLAAPSAPGAATLPASPQAAGSTAGSGSLPGSMLVTTKHGSVLVPANFPRRESKDHQMHACMRPGEGGAMRLICIFLPPAM